MSGSRKIIGTDDTVQVLVLTLIFPKRKSLLLYKPYHNLQKMLQDRNELSIRKDLLLSLIDLEGSEMLPLLTMSSPMALYLLSLFKKPYRRFFLVFLVPKLCLGTRKTRKSVW